MIERTEIEEKAKQFEIHVSNVERDYIFGWVINGFFTVSSLKDEIFLKGGNALRKGYFENTRFSTDLDFGIPGDIEQPVLLGEINKICDYIQERTGVAFITENSKVEEKFPDGKTPIPGLRVYEARIYFKDFYANSDHLRIKISLDITRFDKVLLPIQTVNLIHPYSDATEVSCLVRCMKLEEIIATKLKCLLQRQHAPDLFDYVYSIKLLGGSLNKNEIIEALVEKTIFKRNPHVLKDILVQTPFDYFREYWSKTIICAKHALLEIDETISFFTQDLLEAFSMFPDSGYRDFVFFGPELRVPIMHAGRTQTLLKVRYKHADRVVEPYSLKYLQTKDGKQREYLYVHNCSGGENAPGQRMFVAENFQSIENTTDSFTPRVEIELTKAGEVPENPYLFDPNKPTPPPRSRRTFGLARGSGFGVKYIYDCIYCGKRSVKATSGNSIRPHKTKDSSYPCPGRTGFYIDTLFNQ